MTILGALTLANNFLIGAAGAQAIRKTTLEHIMAVTAAAVALDEHVTSLPARSTISNEQAIAEKTALKSIGKQATQKTLAPSETIRQF